MKPQNINCRGVPGWISRGEDVMVVLFCEELTQLVNKKYRFS